MRRSKSQPPALEPFRRRPSTSSRRIAASSNHAERSLLDRDNYCCLLRRRLRRATNARLGCFGRRRGTLGSNLLLDLRQRLNVLTQYLTGSKEERSPRTGLSPGFNPGWAPSLIASLDWLLPAANTTRKSEQATSPCVYWRPSNRDAAINSLQLPPLFAFLVQ